MEINGLDAIDVLKQMNRRQRRYLALLLSDLEEVVEDKATYRVVRKLVLDHFNDFGRSVARIIVGEEIEGLEFR